MTAWRSNGADCRNRTDDLPLTRRLILSVHKISPSVKARRLPAEVWVSCMSYAIGCGHNVSWMWYPEWYPGRPESLEKSVARAVRWTDEKVKALKLPDGKPEQ